MDKKQRDRSNLIMRLIALFTIIIVTIIYVHGFMYANMLLITKVLCVGFLSFLWYQIYSIFKHKAAWY